MKKVLFPLFVLAFIFTPTIYIFADEPVKILIVPGHDDKVWGAQYGNIKEAAMNLAVASRIYNILKEDKRFEVYITRDKNGYAKEFANYLSLQGEQIVSFREEAKEAFSDLIENGFFLEKESVPHNTASEDVSVILYGINKWANENKMDAVIHVHFNDYPRKNKWTIGDYTGFVIYIPDRQMGNGFESGQLGYEIFLQLNTKYTTSTYEEESGGLVEDQKLIALGPHATLLDDVRSVLIEYGYIYEKKFRNYTTRHKAYDDMAKLTANGIKKYFFLE